jgi:hypothetical protein
VILTPRVSLTSWRRSKERYNKNMKNRVIYFAAALALSVVGYIFSNSTTFSICSKDQYTCRNLLNEIGDPLFYGASALAVVFLLLIFLPKAFPAWRKFAIWFVPLAALLFVFYPEPGAFDLFSPNPETVFRWVSGLYVIVSVVLIVRTSLKK